MTKADFVEWKSHPVTKKVFDGVALRIYDLQVELGHNAGSDSIYDSRRSGAIQALTDFLNTDFDEESQ